MWSHCGWGGMQTSWLSLKIQRAMPGKCWNGMREGLQSPSARSAAAVTSHRVFFWRHPAFSTLSDTMHQLLALIHQQVILLMCCLRSVWQQGDTDNGWSPIITPRVEIAVCTYSALLVPPFLCHTATCAPIMYTIRTPRMQTLAFYSRSKLTNTEFDLGTPA